MDAWMMEMVEMAWSIDDSGLLALGCEEARPREMPCMRMRMGWWKE